MPLDESIPPNMIVSPALIFRTENRISAFWLTSLIQMQPACV